MNLSSDDRLPESGLFLDTALTWLGPPAEEFPHAFSIAIGLLYIVTAFLKGKSQYANDYLCGHIYSFLHGLRQVMWSNTSSSSHQVVKMSNRDPLEIINEAIHQSG